MNPEDHPACLSDHLQDTKRLFEGEALMRRMYKYGLLEESQNKLDYVLALMPADFLERRLQTLVFKLGLAKSIHHARVLIRQRHIRWVYDIAVPAVLCKLRFSGCHYDPGGSPAQVQGALQGLVRAYSYFARFVPMASPIFVA